MKSITLRRASGLALLAAVFGAPAAALDLALPFSAQETVARLTEAGSYDLPIGAWSEANGLPVASLEGRVQRRAWSISGTLTTGQVMAPLRKQLVDAGYDIIFECTARTCGGFDFRFATEVLRAPAMYVDLTDYRFLSAKGPKAERAITLMVSRDGDTVFVQMIDVGPSGVSVVATAPLLSSNDPSDLVARLETVGHAVLNDLDFATGSFALGGDHVQSLDTLADYLLRNPERQITFVGHTDATGSLAANIALSRQRAAAARDYLTRAGVPVAQVDADGVGYLAPRASNLTEAGRDANRRVEAVLISVE
ncbi:OmpA family protein [Marivita sp. GX14005]|uniref:OmpA family protein n=1 Tax=Marivita sp. GX14005 TaxID=2942276 RepID=UPI002018FD89|nr:OmpA family protein [Marivita sp. GX14005]MCL3881848.1 OmpA family protein [Marivita sp. GX14005]